jgi:hypothetical protein
MESTLHRQLKALYAPAAEHREVVLDGYRIDAVAGGRLIEIQSAPLGAIRDKVRTLLQRHDVLVVKPLAARTLIVKCLAARTRRQNETRRYSPKRRTYLDVFEELVHFVGAFPHPRLALDVVLVDVEERRVPSRRRRRFGRDYKVADRSLLGIEGRLSLRTPADLVALLPPELPQPFTTEHLARLAEIPRWLAQKMAYCLRQTGAVEVTGKSRNAWLYDCPASRKAA